MVVAGAGPPASPACPGHDGRDLLRPLVQQRGEEEGVHERPLVGHAPPHALQRRAAHRGVDAGHHEPRALHQRVAPQGVVALRAAQALADQEVHIGQPR
eukprot:scaffold119344_cov34-Prasinocladus_malaysianus.AAC.1